MLPTYSQLLTNSLDNLPKFVSMEIPTTENKYSTEQQNWLAFQQGSEQAYANIYTNNFSHLFRYGKKFTQNVELIEDCIQDLYVNLWKSRENLSIPDSVRNYLYKSLRFSIFKRLKVQEDASLDDILPDEYHYETTAPQETFLISEIDELEKKAKIEKALLVLSKRQREAIFLKFYSELSYQEIGELMQISVQAVYNLISKSLLQLQKEFI
jgi:RNA polymerase sigma factor (sigma-70 family)